MNFRKYKLYGLTNILRHYLREYIQRDGHIDPSRTKNNVFLDGSLLPSEVNCNQINKMIQDEIKETTKKDSFRKDAVVMVDLIITQPKYLGDQYDKEFFEKMNKFCQKTFGDNQVCSVVHLDEATPHMHYSFMPITKDNRLCCKEILTRKFLKNFHQMAEKETGYKLIDTEDDRKKKLSLADYKRLMAMRNEIKDLDKQITEKKNEMILLDKEYDNLNNELNLFAIKRPFEAEKKKDDINIPPKKMASAVDLKSKYKDIADTKEIATKNNLKKIIKKDLTR